MLCRQKTIICLSEIPVFDRFFYVEVEFTLKSESKHAKSESRIFAATTPLSLYPSDLQSRVRAVRAKNEFKNSDCGRFV